MLNNKARQPIQDCWADQVPSGEPHCLFTQGEMDRTPGGADVAVDGHGRTVNVKEGCCREFVRMWLFARRNPGACAGAPQSTFAEKNELAETPELRLVRMHMNTVIVSQALVDAELVDLKLAVAGLAFKSVKKKVGVDRLADKHLWEDGGALFYAQVGTADGTHGLGFDTRGGEFHYFDPEYGVFWCADAGAAKAGLVTFVKEYYRHAGYTGMILIRYAGI
jgi:hypothetical protein